MLQSPREGDDEEGRSSFESEHIEWNTEVSWKEEMSVGVRDAKTRRM